MSCPTEPCGNEDCDKCDPRPRWICEQHRIQHITYTREIKAATAEEAMEIFEAGTQWPSSYDDRQGEVVQLDPTTVKPLEMDEGRRRHYLEDCCFHSIRERRYAGLTQEQVDSLLEPE
jgi:hypothetical protein